MPSSAPPAIAAVCQSTVSPAPTVRQECEQRPDDRDDLEDADRDPEQQPVRLADEPERDRDDGRDEHDSTIWPRTNAPSFRSISCHVSLTVFRFGRGMKRVTRSIA